jgi:protein gp37
MPTKIEWCNETWGPLTGCSKISPGCQNCYAERMAKRLAGRYGYSKDDPFGVTFHHDKLSQPLKWKKPRRIFVCSMGDLFHEDVPFDFIAAIFGVMAFCQCHTFIVLTKRPDRMARFFKDFHYGDYQRNYNWWKNEAASLLNRHSPKTVFGIRLRPEPKELPLPNVWLGVTAENQEQADKRIPVLLQIPAAVHFVSIEPMLSEIDISRWTINHGYSNSELKEMQLSGAIPFGGYVHGGTDLDWVILGGETGPGARPMHPDWARSIRDQCHSAGTPFFFKQWGEFIPENQMYETWGPAKPWYKWLDGSRSYKVGKKSAGHMLDGRAWRQYP